MGWTEEAEAESVGGIGDRWTMKGRSDPLAGLGRRDKHKKQPASGSWSGSTSDSEDVRDKTSRSPYDMLYEDDDQQKTTRWKRARSSPPTSSTSPRFQASAPSKLTFSPQAQDLIRAMLVSPSNPEGKADLILSDMAANFTGNKVRDTEASLDICLAVFNFAKKNLRTVRETGKTYAGSLLCVLFFLPWGLYITVVRTVS
jgi:hypothetical protein